MDKFQDLFTRWRQSRPEYEHDFVKDGIIDEARWRSANSKVLIVLKETNNFIGDLRSLIRDDWKGPAYSIWHNVARWVYGIQHVTKTSFPDREEAEGNMTEALLSCAALNLKKKSGKSTSDMDEIRSFALADKEFIIEEINFIDPDVIVCGNTFSILQEVLSTQSKPVSNDGYIHKIDGKVFVDFWHPAAQYPSDMMYYFLLCLLQRNM